MDNTALLIIDMQNDIILPESSHCVSRAMSTVPKIMEVLSHARKKKYHIFHVTRAYRADGSNVEISRASKFVSGDGFAISGTHGCEIIKDLTPELHEYKIIKPRFSAFMQTELDFILRRLAIKNIFICGTQYPNCIRATAYDALCLDYNVTVITDATSAMTVEIENANIYDMQTIGIRCMLFADILKL